MPKSWFTVRAQAESGQPAEVAIRGYIGEWGVTDRDFIAAVQALGDVPELTVRLNTRGGEVDHALGVFNFLRSHAARVVMRIDGVAMSSGSIIAMAGDEIVMPANTVMMVHNPWGYVMGDAKGLRKAAEDLETWEAALIETYVARTGKSEDEIRALLDEETYMTAAEAVELGFADRVEPVGKKAASAAAAVAFASALGIPEDVLARIRAAEEGTPGAEDEDAANDPDPDADPSDADPSDTDPPDDTLPAQIHAAAVAAGLGEFVGVWVLDGQITAIAQAREAIDEARQVRDLCVFAGAADQAPGFIRARRPLAEVRAALINARADAADAQPTDGHQPGSGQRPASPGARAVTELGDVYARNRNSARKAFPRMF